MGDPNKLMPWMCGARLANRPGQVCHAAKLRGEKRCKMHGGRPRRGKDHPGYKHGRFCDLGSQVASRLAVVNNDPDLFESREELAMLTLREQDIAKRVQVGDTPEWRDAIRAACRGFTKASAKNDEDGMKEHLGNLLRLGEQGASLDDGWETLISVMERRAALAQKETKRMIDTHAVFTVDQVGYMLSVIADSVKRYVQDPVIIQQITRDFDATFNSGSVPATGYGGGLVGRPKP